MEEHSISELQTKMEKGETRALQLVQYFLDRIDEIDIKGPGLHSVIELNPDALKIAEALDRERAAGKLRGPLHGIPILIKDNIDTGDRMQTTSGSLALEGSIAGQDAFLVERLRQSGAVILGKTNLSEWAHFRSDHGTSGWSSRGGQTCNPYALDRNPCGSSSGSAVAVAAYLCAAAIGTETDGSIVCPSHANGIVGIKPTLGLVSRSGVIPIAHSQDTAGPMARTVEEAAILLGALTGIDERDPATRSSKGRSFGDYTPFLDPGGLRGSRIGVARSYFKFDGRVAKLMEGCLDLMKQEGAVLVDPVELLDESRLNKSELEVLYYEFKADLNAYLGALGPEARVHSLQEVIQFNEENKDLVMPFFLQERMERAQAKGPLTQKGYLKALERNLRLSRTEGIDKTLAAHKLDAIVAPTGGPAWLTDQVLGDHFSGGGFSSLAAVAGYPHITVPAGTIFGLPVGISFFASAWSEPVLIRLAYAFEKASQVRQPPKFLPTAEVSLDSARQALKTAQNQSLRI